MVRIKYSLIVEFFIQISIFFLCCCYIIKYIFFFWKIFGEPFISEIQSQIVEGKCILVSGDDLLTLYNVLKETNGTGINVYSHSDMWGGFMYPTIKKFQHFKGFYGKSFFF